MVIYYSFPIIYGYISEYNGRLNMFFLRGTMSALSLPFLGCYRCNANGCSQNTSPFLHLKENAPCYGNSRKKWASLAAIVRCIMIMLSIHYLQIFKTGYFFHKSIAIKTNETANYDFILPSKTCLRHLETSAANVCDLIRSDQSLNKTLLIFVFCHVECSWSSYINRTDRLVC